MPSEGKSRLPDHAPEHRSCIAEGCAAMPFADINVDASALSHASTSTQSSAVLPLGKLVLSALGATVCRCCQSVLAALKVAGCLQSSSPQ